MKVLTLVLQVARKEPGCPWSEHELLSVISCLREGLPHETPEWRFSRRTGRHPLLLSDGDSLTKMTLLELACR